MSEMQGSIAQGRALGVPARTAPAALQTAAVGVSTSETCGVRDHAVLLAEGLAREQVSCSLPWLWRTAGSLRESRREVTDWLDALGRQLGEQQLDAVILHYSVFAYSYRGFPLFVSPTLSALRRLRVPLVTIVHEHAYPWGRGGVRGRAWASSQRAIMLAVMRASSAVVVTADFRAAWIRSRTWLPKRPVVTSPVFSNLPQSSVQPTATRDGALVGLFGYAYEGAAVSLVLDALRELHDRGIATRIALLGAPGRESGAAQAWVRGADARGLPAPEFSGKLPAAELSDALAACDVLLSAEPAGPTSRKTTLAASLASGRPVVALDGPRRWLELVNSGAALVVEPRADALAEGLVSLLEDESRRQALGARGREFAARAMSVEHSASVLAELLRDLVAPASR